MYAKRITTPRYAVNAIRLVRGSGEKAGNYFPATTLHR